MKSIYEYLIGGGKRYDRIKTFEDIVEGDVIYRYMFEETRLNSHKYKYKQMQTFTVKACMRGPKRFRIQSPEGDPIDLDIQWGSWNHTSQMTTTIRINKPSIYNVYSTEYMSEKDVIRFVKENSSKKLTT